MFREHHVRKSRLVSVRSVNLSVTRSHRVTSHSVHVSSSRWSLSSSASRIQTLSGFAYWKNFCLNWLYSLGLKDEEVRYRDHDAEELSFYSKATTDVEFLFPFGWGELWGIADRTDYDLTQHQNVSGQDLTYFDDEKKTEIHSICNRTVTGS